MIWLRVGFTAPFAARRQALFTAPLVQASGSTESLALP
jgi:hypothetical protein